MSNSMKAGLIVACLVVVGGVLFFATQDNSTESNSITETNNLRSSTQAQPTSSDNASSSDMAGPITKEQVALHASEDDCWTIINGEVYDITSYIPRHPGGDNILSACGVDGTDLFNGEKASQQGESNRHGSSARSALSSLKIGTLAE